MAQIKFETKFSGGKGTLVLTHVETAQTLTFTEESDQVQYMKIPIGSHLISYSGTSPEGKQGNIHLEVTQESVITENISNVNTLLSTSKELRKTLKNKLRINIAKNEFNGIDFTLGHQTFSIKPDLKDATKLNLMVNQESLYVTDYPSGNIAPFVFDIFISNLELY